MADTGIEELREILAQATARDEALRHLLEELARDIMTRLGRAADAPVWAKIEAAERERQVSPSFVLTEGRLRGDLVVEVAPEQIFTVSISVREMPNHTHEASLTRERSQTLVIDGADDRADAREKFVAHVFANLVSQVRERVALPA